jgi:hypothetical protein
MKTFASFSLSALLGGLVAYFFLRWIAVEVKPSVFTNLIGVAALAGGLLGALLSKWLGGDKEE